jgi:ceramide glucosyltransferase
VSILSHLDVILILGSVIVSLLYTAFATYRVIVRTRSSAYPTVASQPVTVLKPVCGEDADLYENLRSFCRQNYPTFQIIFGVRAVDDPAIPIIKQIMQELPGRDLTLIINDRIIGTNFKVCNLANMLVAAKHEILVVADSDMRVGPDYLAAVTAPFADPRVGVATCLYKGTALYGWTSRLASMFINEWFLPSVLVALSFEKLNYCFGATVAVRREALEAIGGFAALAYDLADDHQLGKLIQRQGYKVELVSYLVENRVHEPSFKTLFLHELRWARTIRVMRPLGYAFSFVTFPVPVALLLVLLTPFKFIGMVALTVALALRVLLHYTVRLELKLHDPPAPWLIPLRDLVCFIVWCASFMGRRVHWRGERFHLDPAGQLRLIEGKTAYYAEDPVAKSPLV